MRTAQCLSLVALTALSPNLWAQCSSQGVPQGEYQIISTEGQNGVEYCVDRDSKDRGNANGGDQNVYDLQFLRCNGTVWQRFSIGHPDARGCYQIWSVADGGGADHRAWAKEVGGGEEQRHWAHVLNVKCADAGGHCTFGNFYWKINRLSNGSYTIRSAGEDVCIDRRNDESPAVPQAIFCHGVGNQAFMIRPTGARRSKKAQRAKTTPRKG